ncbi:conserved exported hypothetical protein [Rhodospirillaceae bacterium LM-1]|nr:conserved exported hypothetical protein [Rhodospirillaceae bacterium LM-1]
MKYSALIITLGLLASGQAWSDETVKISRQDCSRLIHHAPSADVAYKPGVDVKGRAVAPADLGGGANNIKLLPDVLEFNVSINPVDYQARNALAKQKADAQKAIVANQQAKAAAETQVTALTAQQATLAASGVTLAADLAPLQAVLTPLQAQVDANTLRPTNQDYQAALAAVTAKQAEIAANTASQASVATSLAAQQAIVAAAPATETSLTQTQTTVEAKQSALSAKGLDGTSMTAAAIKYDIAKNKFLINGQPLNSPDMEALAEACAKAGVK